MKPRLQDVAERAGVSMKTVSNVINDYRHISADTRSRVLTAIDELGYRPNLAARNLARGRTGMIALVLPRLDFPYFASLSGNVLDAARAVGCEVLIEQTGGDPESERRALAGDFARRIDGLILSPVSVTAEEIDNRSDRTPLVLLGEVVTGAQVPRIAIDNVAAAELAVSHLIGLGRRRIGMIGASAPRRGNSRYTGYRRALRSAGLSAHPHWIRPVRSTEGSEGERAMSAVLDAGEPSPDAVFCATDWLALGAVRALHRRGLRVPEDVAVVGFDAIPYGEVTSPSLTTIAPDRAEIARRAIRLLAGVDGRGAAGLDHSDVGFRLIVRESTAGPDLAGRA